MFVVLPKVSFICSWSVIIECYDLPGILNSEFSLPSVESSSRKGSGLPGDLSYVMQCRALLILRLCPTAVPPGACSLCGPVPGNPVCRSACDVHHPGQRSPQSQAAGTGPPVWGSDYANPTPGRHLHRTPPRKEEGDRHVSVRNMDPR